jgi:predicted O-methyltransferase YrrM
MSTGKQVSTTLATYQQTSNHQLMKNLMGISINFAKSVMELGSLLGLTTAKLATAVY